MRDRPLHVDFQALLSGKEPALGELFYDLRSFILDLCPDSNELLYHTHALTAVYSLSEKLGDAFCHIPIYQHHLNLGFNKGALLSDPEQLLQGTGKWIRHIPIKERSDFMHPAIEALVQEALTLAAEDMEAPSTSKGKTISKIKSIVN